MVTPRDIERLCVHLGMFREDFSLAYLERINGKMRVRTENGWCVFFAQGCSVHPAKPMVCRAWPFFQGNMLDESSWTMAQDACPGINPEAGHADFVRQGLEHIQSLDAAIEGEGPNALDLKRISATNVFVGQSRQ